MNAQADLHLCYLHMAKTGFLIMWLRLSLSRIEGQVHLKAVLQDSEVVTYLRCYKHSRQTFYFQIRKINSKTFVVFTTCKKQNNKNSVFIVKIALSDPDTSQL